MQNKDLATFYNSVYKKGDSHVLGNSLPIPLVARQHPFIHRV